MKFVLALLVALTFSAFAEDVATEDNAHWGYTCSNDEVLNLAPNNMKIVGTSDLNVLTIDEKAIKLDRKNKTATVWATYIAKPEMTETWARNYGSDYTNNTLGYIKQLKVFDLSTAKVKSLTLTSYKCSGVNIETVNGSGSGSWSYVVQGSVDGELLKYLKGLK